MAILHEGLGPFPELDRVAARLRRLADDLERIAGGHHPGVDELKDAPLLMEWMAFAAPAPHLVGIVLGHPEIPDGHVCRTSELFSLNREQSYARTRSRFYRLGDQAE